jgi:hypothetical protein
MICRNVSSFVNALANNNNIDQFRHYNDHYETYGIIFMEIYVFWMDISSTGINLFFSVLISHIHLESLKIEIDEESIGNKFVKR